jgi:hypothetical protein
MVAWLEGGEDAPSDVEVWGLAKGQYGFGDLSLYLKRGAGLVSDEELKGEKKSTKWKEKGSKFKGKGKGKEKAQSSKKSHK